MLDSELEYNFDGLAVCQDCMDENCQMCLIRPSEVELSNGDYVCSHCYSGLIDSASDRYGER